MVIKLRKFSRHIAVKIAAFLIIVAAVTVSAMQFVNLFGAEFGTDILFMKNYRSSWHYASDLENAVSWIDYYALNENADLDKIDGLEYYIKLKDGNVIANVSLDTITEKNPSTDTLAFTKLRSKYDDSTYEGLYSEYNSDAQYIRTFDIVNTGIEAAYMRYTPEFLAKQQAEWEKQRASFDYRTVLMGLAIGVLLSIYLALVAGRKAEDNELHMHQFDRLYTEIQLGALVIIFILSACVMTDWIYDGMMNLQYMSGVDVSLLAVLAAVIIVVALILIGILLMSFVRKLKAGTFIKQSIIYKIFSFIFGGIANLFRSLFGWKAFEKYPLTKALFIRQCIFVCASTVTLLFVGGCIGIAMTYYAEFFIFAVFGMAAEAGLLYWYLTGSVKGYDEINKGMSHHLEEQMKAERMKVSLVTNVSHDLKTPLTSIISYVDLLSKEDLSPTARDYVMVLAQKSDRLKHIVADLFDLSKVSSGDITLELEQLDIKRLVEQTLADMGDSITASELEFKVKMPIYPVYILGDGKKLYRVMQNIIGNTLKYAMKRTRVFVDMDSNGERVAIAVKNTSATEMNFTADEILQRFFRGDESRSTEGSGLGLSIAQGLTHACGGDMDLAVDGDLFKVTLSFPIDKNPVTQSNSDQI